MELPNAPRTYLLQQPKQDLQTIFRTIYQPQLRHILQLSRSVETARREGEHVHRAQEGQKRTIVLRRRSLPERGGQRPEVDPTAERTLAEAADGGGVGISRRIGFGGCTEVSRVAVKPQTHFSRAAANHQ